MKRDACHKVLLLHYVNRFDAQITNNLAYIVRICITLIKCKPSTLSSPVNNKKCGERMKTIKLKTISSNATGLIKVIGMIAVALNLVACAGNDYEENADRMDVITIGDSIFDLNGVIEDTLYSYAGETFRNYTKSGAELSGGALATAIDQQYADAKNTDSNINTILMDGAGNDILIPATLFDPYGCRTQWYRWNISNRCVGLIEDQYVTAVNLLNQMAADGVDDVVLLASRVGGANDAHRLVVRYDDALLVRSRHVHPVDRHPIAGLHTSPHFRNDPVDGDASLLEQGVCSTTRAMPHLAEVLVDSGSLGCVVAHGRQRS